MLGMVINTAACMWIIIVWMFSFWPQETPVTAKNMNFSVLMSGSMMVFSVIFYYAQGKKIYSGPVTEITR